MKAKSTLSIFSFSSTTSISPSFSSTTSIAPAQETKVNEGEIDVVELKEKIDRGDNFVLIDVREPHEYRICNIPGAQLIPLGEFPKRVGELDPAADIVIHCRSGVR